MRSPRLDSAYNEADMLLRDYRTNPCDTELSALPNTDGSPPGIIPLKEIPPEDGFGQFAVYESDVLFPHLPFSEQPGETLGSFEGFRKEQHSRSVPIESMNRPRPEGETP